MNPAVYKKAPNPWVDDLIERHGPAIYEHVWLQLDADGCVTSEDAATLATAAQCGFETMVRQLGGD